MQTFVQLLALASAANAASLADIKHVVMLMMENRSFQHVSFKPKTLLPGHTDSGSISAPCPVSVALLIPTSK